MEFNFTVRISEKDIYKFINLFQNNISDKEIVKNKEEVITIDIEDKPDTGLDIEAIGFGQTIDNDTLINTSTSLKDSSGLPHDPRIHTSPPKTNKDGTWRRRKNTEDEEFEKVTKELRNRLQKIDTSVVTIPVPPPPPATIKSQNLVTQSQPQNTAAPFQPQSPNEFNDMMLTLGELLVKTEGRLTHVDLERFANELDCVQISTLQSKPHLIKPFLQKVYDYLG